MKNISKIIVATVIVGLCAVKVWATPSLGQVWGTGNAVNWTTVNIGTPESGVDNGLTGNSITLSFPGGGAAPAATLSTAGYYAGDYASFGLSTLAVRFTYNANILPDPGNGLMFYFTSGGNTWYAANLIQPVATGDQLYDFNIGTISDWNPAIGNVADWNSAFSSISEIGFEVHGPTIGSDSLTYTFSNIQVYDTTAPLAVPEPETLWMIVMVLASLGITFRGRLVELAGQVRARIKA